MLVLLHYVENVVLYPRCLLIYMYERVWIFTLALKGTFLCPKLSVKCCSLVSSLLKICVKVSGNFFLWYLFKTSNSKSDNLSSEIIFQNWESWNRPSFLSTKANDCQSAKSPAKKKTAATAKLCKLSLHREETRMQLLYRSKEAEKLKGMLLKKMLSCPWLQYAERDKAIPWRGLHFQDSFVWSFSRYLKNLGSKVLVKNIISFH